MRKRFFIESNNFSDSFPTIRDPKQPGAHCGIICINRMRRYFPNLQRGKPADIILSTIPIPGNRLVTFETKHMLDDICVYMNGKGTGECLAPGALSLIKNFIAESKQDFCFVTIKPTGETI